MGVLGEDGDVVLGDGFLNSTVIIQQQAKDVSYSSSHLMTDPRARRNSRFGRHDTWFVGFSESSRSSSESSSSCTEYGSCS